MEDIEPADPKSDVPAHAGVSPGLIGLASMAGGRPRARGGEPTFLSPLGDYSATSPRTRG